MLSRLSAEESSRLRAAIRELGTVGQEQRESVPAEVLQAPESDEADAADAEQRQEAPAEALDDTDQGVELVLSDLATRTPPTPKPRVPETPTIEGDPWLHSLGEAEPETIAGFLEREQPAAIALVLSHLPSDVSAAVLALLEDDRRAAVLLQLSRSGDADPAAVRVVATELANWIQQHKHEAKRKAERVAKIQSILDALPASERSTLVERLGEADDELGATLGAVHPLGEPPTPGDVGTPRTEEHPEAALPQAPQEPRELVFARLAKMETRRLLSAARSLPARTALLALAELPPEQFRSVRKHLSRKAWQDLCRRLSTLAPVRLADVEASQRALDAAVRHAASPPRINHKA